VALSLAAVAFSALPAWGQAGLLFTGAGAVNRSMGGATTATALDATGALFWNPATMSGLERSEMAFGVEVVYPQSRLASSVAAGALGPFGPPVSVSGSERSDTGVFAVPSAGLVFKPDGCSPWTFGLGVFGVAGFGVNYPASTTDPILTPQPPRGIGLGSLYSELQVLEIAPAVSCQLSEHLAVGVSPLLALASLRLDPAVVATPDIVAGFAEYPPGTHVRETWGAGVQAGIYYTLDNGWRFGSSIQSPRWFEDFHFQSTNVQGRPRSFNFNADLPMVVSVGTAYSGFERWLLAADVRYIDFANTAGLRDDGFAPSGAVRGTGWRSIFALALGAQYQVSDCLSLRAGYSFNQDPISNAETFFNVASATILEHTVYVGASVNVTSCLTLAVAYAHGIQNSVTGPFVTPTTGPLAGTSVTSVVSADTFLLQAAVKFGAPRDCCH
jgi:long-chain fatty acid transport protein